MLIKAQSIITKISDDANINAQNYMESLDFITELYLFINKLKLVIPGKDIEFLPSFKGKYTCLKLGMVSTEKENQLKFIRVRSRLFLEDKYINKLVEHLGPDCEEIRVVDDVVEFTLI